VTFSRSAQLSLFLSLALALGELPLPAQQPAAAPASEPAAAPASEAAPKPAAEPEKTPKRAKADDDDDRTARPHRKPVAAPLPAPAAAAATPKPGFFQRVFRSNRKQPTPSPVAAATPKPRPKVKKDDDEPKPKPKKDDDETKPKKPPETETPPKADAGEPTEVAPKPPKATPTPRGKRTGPTREPTKSAAAHGSNKEQLALEQAIKGGDADGIEKARYDYARVRAADDEHVRDLKAKADSATTEDEGRKSLRAYNRALFEKMRKLEPTVSERIDRMETAVLKRLGGSDE
jgi:hypothetical protein